MMENVRTLFDSIPDTVIITDTYGYILDFNRSEPFDRLKKGKKLTMFISDCFEGVEGAFSLGDKTYKRYTAQLDNGKNHTGYTVRLSDISEEKLVTEQHRNRSRELNELARELSESNAELMGFVMRVRELADYSEQLRIAKNIHDDHGHAITELYTICRMCLELKDKDPERCKALLAEGMDICRRVYEGARQRDYSSLTELLNDFAYKNAFPTETHIEGEEPTFIKDKYELISAICKEAYHNTLDHSMADKFIVTAQMNAESLTLILTDDGSFHGRFEKGFGLAAMEENIIASGGSVKFDAENGKGFCITAEWRGKK